MAQLETLLRKAISEHVRSILTEDAFRRIIITSPKVKDINGELEKFINRSDIKSNYPGKVKLTVGVKPDTLIVDISAQGATVLGIKVGDIAKKHDRNAVIKTKTEIKRTPIK